MNFAKRALEALFQKPSVDEDAQMAVDRMAREIRGTVFALLALFLLVALSSYLPLDTLNIFQGRLDQVNNFAGIVGALFAEWILGTVGMPGFSTVAIAAALSLCTFAEIPVRDHTMKILGVVLGTFLTAMTCQLIFGSSFPEASLWQGGWAGRFLGGGLRQYFNTGGAALIVTGGYLVTLILTTGASPVAAFQKFFESKDDAEEAFEEEESVEEASAPALALVPAAAAVAAPAPKRSRKKKAADPAVDPDAAVSVDPDADPDATVAAEPAVYSFKQLIPFQGSYNVPSLRLLKNAENKVKRLTRGELKEKAQMIVQHLESFQITGTITAITEGPVLTTYEYKPAAGVKLSKIAGLQEDLGVVLGTNQLRIVAPIPGKTVVGIEVPRPQAETIPLKMVLDNDSFQDKGLKLPVALGKSTDGKPLFGDLAAMPHLLVAGSTGSGKSVFMNSLIMSFLFRMTPQELRLILIDPKMLEFAAFSGLPHLITDVITDNKVAINAMNWAVTEMDRRYAMMAKTNSKNIESYNSKMKGAEKLPYIVVVVDELADLMMTGGEEVEIAITRIAQKARAAGIHLVLATQRPSAEIVTGLIKANVPSRISFKVPSGIDSRTILDNSGAEELIGRGDSLMIQPSVPLRRIHGTFVTEEELARVVKYVKDGKNHSKNYITFAGSKSED
ncbi:DNA translocase FtsK 4TM domain-containing protein [bacterium]|nr:DNA translocase FtsK 4TM domain-containing protein [bacterium]